MIEIIELSEFNVADVATLAFKLWPDSTFQEEYRYFQEALDDPSKTAFLLSEENIYTGLIHLSLRTDYVDGTNSNPVCYIEGLYIEPDFRGKGYAQNLIHMAETWGKQKGCLEIASDAEINNQAGINLHKKLGFKEISRIVTFAKRIN